MGWRQDCTYNRPRPLAGQDECCGNSAYDDLQNPSTVIMSRAHRRQSRLRERRPAHGRPTAYYSAPSDAVARGTQADFPSSDNCSYASLASGSTPASQDPHSLAEFTGRVHWPRAAQATQRVTDRGSGHRRAVSARRRTGSGRTVDSIESAVVQKIAQRRIPKSVLRSRSLHCG
jgi:hypothetical protein